MSVHDEPTVQLCAPWISDAAPHTRDQIEHCKAKLALAKAKYAELRRDPKRCATLNAARKETLRTERVLVRARIALENAEKEIFVKLKIRSVEGKWHPDLLAAVAKAVGCRPVDLGDGYGTPTFPAYHALSAIRRAVAGPSLKAYQTAVDRAIKDDTRAFKVFNRYWSASCQAETRINALTGQIKLGELRLRNPYAGPPTTKERARIVKCLEQITEGKLPVEGYLPRR
jgi:hypothetical protein